MFENKSKCRLQVINSNANKEYNDKIDIDSEGTTTFNLDIQKSNFTVIKLKYIKLI